MTEARAPRLFFALWPDDEVRAAITSRTREVVATTRGRPVVPDNLHITLAFLGTVGPERLACVEHVAAPSPSSFDLSFSEIAYWKRSRILSLLPRETPAALAGMVAALWQALAACGFTPEAREFRAHVTLARDARRPHPEMLAIEPVRWPVRGFSLVESVTDPAGARYTVRSRYQ